MKNGLLFLFVAIMLGFSSCNFWSDKTPEVIVEEQQQIQQQFEASELEVAEEPEFVIEADYDPTLAEKAEKNKKQKTEETSPITLTEDDDDLEEDRDDLPSRVMTRSIRAYDYQNTKETKETREEAIIDDPENNIKGVAKRSKSTKDFNKNALFFVVAGAYKDNKAAEKKVKEIEALGYRVELISFDKNFKTVCVAKLESRNQADLLAWTLQNENVDAYVVKRRK